MEVVLTLAAGLLMLIVGGQLVAASGAALGLPPGLVALAQRIALS